MVLSFPHLAFVFLLYSFLGWLAESLLTSVFTRKPVSRGILLGPWMPSYGIGAVVILFGAGFFSSRPVIVFLQSALIGSFISFLFQWVLVKFFDTKLIDISWAKVSQRKFTLLHGVLQGLFGIILIYALHPALTRWFSDIFAPYSRLLTGLLLAALGTDFLQSLSSITSMYFSLQEVRGLMQEIETLGFEWYDPSARKQSLDTLRRLCSSETNPSDLALEKAILDRLHHLQLQFLGAQRLIRIYPRILPEGFKEEAEILRQESDFRRDSFKKRLLHPYRRLWADSKEAWASLSVSKLFWLFTVSSVFGYVVEKLFAFVVYGSLESRQGVLYGPFCQVYGIGAIILTLTILPFSKDKNSMVFLFGGIIGGLSEALMSWGQEIIFGSVSWHYDAASFGILGGRTSLTYMLFWGVLSVLYIRLIYPWINNLIDHLHLKSNRFLTIPLALFLAVNLSLSSLAVIRWSERQHHKAPSSSVGIWLDKQYPDTLMQEIYPNMHFL